MKRLMTALFLCALVLLMLTPVTIGVNKTSANSDCVRADGVLPPPPFPPPKLWADGVLPPPPFPPPKLWADGVLPPPPFPPPKLWADGVLPPPPFPPPKLHGVAA